MTLLLCSRHHRSDSFSSVLSLGSIATAILFPGLLVADSAAGILVAGMICLTGVEVRAAKICLYMHACMVVPHV